MPEILIIDDDRSIRRSLELHLQGSGNRVRTASNLAAGWEIWERDEPDLIILDLVLPDGTGIDLIKRSEQESCKSMVIMITGHQDMDKAIAAMRAGAFDYIHKPIDIDELDIAIERALAVSADRNRLALIADLSTERSPGKIVGESRAILELHKQIGSVSRGRANVLIRGESGTGKELVARAIHRNASTAGPFIPVNCSAIVPTLLESELFGHERGAFTGAVGRKQGRFEVAGDGTLFLDEIADMDIGLQAKLLRVIQEREFQRVGGNDTINFSARIITATNRDLETMTAAGEFREDLYYRLKVVEIVVPPLRDRLEDIPPLVEHLLARLNHELRRNVTRVPDELLAALNKYHWPGNVRELENLLMAGVMRSSGDTLQIDSTAITGVKHQIVDSSEGEQTGRHLESNWRRSIQDVEREHIELVLRQVDGHLGRACSVLGISRPTLRKKLSEYGLNDNHNTD